jgi:esterase/lipase
MNSLFMISNNDNLFLDPQLEYPHLSPQLSFSEYIKQCNILIKRTRLDLQTHAESIIQANAPFELRPQLIAPQINKKKEENLTAAVSFNPVLPSKTIQCGALLIHGLLDSPYTMRDIGVELQKNDLLVRAVLLQGHGTIPGALLHTDYREWVETVRYGVDTLKKEVEQIFLVGFSTGGTLALYHAATYPEKIAGVVLISPALKINCPFDFLANWPARGGEIWPRMAWFHRDKEETKNYTRYLSTPFNAAYQVYHLARKVKKLNAPACPLFFALSRNDLTVLSRVSIHYFLNSPHPKNRMILYNNKCTKRKCAKSRCANIDNDDRIIVRSSRYADKHIDDFTHTTLPTAPNNPFYGKNGTYCEASRIEEKKAILYGEHYIPLMHFHNILFKLKLVRYEYQRLSFNPDFLFLSEQIKQFIVEAIADSSR